MTRLLAVLLLLLLAAGGLLIAVVDNKPLVSRSETISPNAVAQARWLFSANDPRRLQAGEARRTAIPAALIDEGINYIASRFLRGRGSLLLADDSAQIRFSLRLPYLPGEYFLNLSATLRETQGEPHLAAARLGTLPVPPVLVEFFIAHAIRLAGYEQEWQLARKAISSLEFDPQRQRVTVAYVWEPALLDRARNFAINPQDITRIRSAHEALAALLDHRAPGSRMALPEVLSSLLNVGGEDQTANRRAVLLAVAAYLSEKNLAHVIPEAQGWPRIRPVMLTLLGRHDSAQHFAISSALAAWAGEPIADAIGVYKEMLDSRHGSGFSFADLAADRAGTRFGEQLTRHPERIDQLLAKEFSDQNIAPSLNGLPEYLSEREFRLRFGSPGSPAYQQIQNEIERRLNKISLYE